MEISENVCQAPIEEPQISIARKVFSVPVAKLEEIFKGLLGDDIEEFVLDSVEYYGGNHYEPERGVSVGFTHKSKIVNNDVDSIPLGTQPFVGAHIASDIEEKIKAMAEKMFKEKFPEEQKAIIDELSAPLDQAQAIHTDGNPA